MDRFFIAFPAFRHKNYRLYFGGQLISLIGTWLQMVALGWLVLELTHSAFWVGLVAAISSLPVLIFILFGGVIVDRLPKKNILLFTQISAMIFAFILGILVVFRVINVTEIIILSFLLGLVNALDVPARQSFVIEMVGKNDLASAIALNSGIFNSARIIGPAIAGVIIAIFGTGGAFILNAVSYIAVVIALVLIKVNIEIPKVHAHPLKALKEGIVYSFSHSVIRVLLIFTGLSSIFGWSYSTIMPVVVKNIFHLGADSLGYFYSFTGIGAIIGVILVSTLSKKINHLFFILIGNFLFIFSIICFSFTSTLIWAMPFLFLAGMGLIMQFSTINTAIQHLVLDHMRGRVMSIYGLMFMGLFPIGSFEVGFMAEHFGCPFAIRFGAVTLFLFSILLFFNHKQIQKELEKHMRESKSEVILNFPNKT